MVDRELKLGSVLKVDDGIQCAISDEGMPDTGKLLKGSELNPSSILHLLHDGFMRSPQK